MKNKGVGFGGIIACSFLVSLLGGAIFNYVVVKSQLETLKVQINAQAIRVAPAPPVEPRERDKEIDRNQVMKLEEIAKALRETQKQQTQAQTQPAPELPKIIAAQKFILVNDQGKALGVLGLGDSGAPQLVLYDSTGAERAGLILSGTGSSVKFFLKSPPDQNKTVLLSLDDLGAGFGIINENKAYAGLAIANDKFPKLYLSRQGDAAVELSVREGETGSLIFTDKTGKSRAVLGPVVLKSESKPVPFPLSLNFFDKDGNLIWQAPPEK